MPCNCPHCFTADDTANELIERIQDVIASEYDLRFCGNGPENCPREFFCNAHIVMISRIKRHNNLCPTKEKV